MYKQAGASTLNPAVGGRSPAPQLRRVVTLLKLGITRALGIAVLAAGMAGGAFAQDFPTKPISLVVPFAAGTPADLFARALSDQLTPLLKQTVLVDNRPGAYQILAGTRVARAAPDGYTLMLVSMPNVMPAELQKGLPYAGNTDFEAVAYIGSLNMVLVVSPGLPVSNLTEFAALMKANPDKYMYGSGVGTPPHLSLAMLNRLAGTRSQHVPYASFQAITTDVSSGQIQFSLVPAAAMQLAAMGRLKALGTTAAKRDPAYPDVPTLDEQGFKGLNDVIKFFVLAPKGTPAAIVGKLGSAINSVIATDTFYKKLAPLGGVTIPGPLPAAEVARQIASDDERFQGLVRQGLIKLE